MSSPFKRKHRSVVVADGLVARPTFASDISGEAMSIDAMRVPSEVFSRISDVSTDSRYGMLRNPAIGAHNLSFSINKANIMNFYAKCECWRRRSLQSNLNSSKLTHGLRMRGDRKHILA